MTAEEITINYIASATARRFHESNATVRGVRGPIGSGKSVMCCVEVFNRAQTQAPNRQGVRETSWAFIRSTYGDLINTTMKTWARWFPDEICHIKMSPPITGKIRMPLADGTTMEADIHFIACDSEDDIKHLKSLDLTGVWVNEAVEISRAAIDMAIGRTGRFPDFKRDKNGNETSGATWSGVIMDTNPPDDEHWWYEWAEKGTPEGYEFFAQPPAVLMKGTASSPLYVPNDGSDPRFAPAENVENYKEGWRYYMKQVPGKSYEWIKVFLMGEYGTVIYGKPVFPEYMDRIHYAGKPVEVLSGLPIIIGWDFGVTHSACQIAQLSYTGQLRFLKEFYLQEAGVRSFAQTIVKPYLAHRFPGFKIISVGDPAGMQRSASTESTCMQILGECGLATIPARTNLFVARREVVAKFLTRTVNGQPGLLISSECPMLRQGMQGKYFFKRMQLDREIVYRGEPEKNSFSHPNDAGQYVAVYADCPNVAADLCGRPMGSSPVQTFSSNTPTGTGALSMAGFF